MKKTLRRWKVLVDWSQNNGSKTTVCPYSLRGRLRPTVAAPRTWEEIEAGDLAHLELGEVLERIESGQDPIAALGDRKSTRLNSSHVAISYAVFCLKKKKKQTTRSNSKLAQTQDH